MKPTYLLCSLLLMLSCATAKLEPAGPSPFLTEKVWTVMDSRDPLDIKWKEYRFLVIHNPTIKKMSTTVDCNTFIAEVVVESNTSIEILLAPEDVNCITR